MGQLHGAMAALPHLKRRGGALTHSSSMGAPAGVPLQTAYCAFQHGIDGVVETLRMEGQREELRISVTNVMAATINTNLFDQARTKIGSSRSRRRRTTSRTSWWTQFCTPRRTRAGSGVGGSARALILGEPPVPA
jgi:NAD(P)-dependent dehydrogenase (short-subunit alcohol dehydrogenase family)